MLTSQLTVYAIWNWMLTSECCRLLCSIHHVVATILIIDSGIFASAMYTILLWRTWSESDSDLKSCWTNLNKSHEYSAWSSSFERVTKLERLWILAFKICRMLLANAVHWRWLIIGYCICCEHLVWRHRSVRRQLYVCVPHMQVPSQRSGNYQYTVTCNVQRLNGVMHQICFVFFPPRK